MRNRLKFPKQKQIVNHGERNPAQRLNAKKRAKPIDKAEQTITLSKMKITHLLLALSLVSLTACSTTTPATNHDSPETMFITYHVQPGDEAKLQEVLSRAWDIYRKNHLVLTQPHVIIRAMESGGKTRFVEVFTWVSHAAPGHAPASVKKIWEQMQSLCEARDGHIGLEGGEVEMIVPKL